MPNPAILFESAGQTDIGRKRKTNQDAFLCREESGLFVVADGMGGQRGGDVASRMAVRAILDCFEQNPAPARFDDAFSAAANRLISGIYQANTDVFLAAGNDPSLKGMGTTVSAVLFTDQTVIAANVGDSPIFLIRDGQMDDLFVSHSMAAGMDPDRSEFRQARHMLTRAVGADETVRVDSCEIQCFTDDIIVLCSDGMSNMVARDIILETVRSCPPADACRKLITLANDNGGNDNITIIVVKVREIMHNKKNRVRKILSGLFKKYRQKIQVRSEGSKKCRASR